jgi:hypothetical protein
MPKAIYLILSAIGGGVTTSVFFPIINYFFARVFNWSRVRVYVDPNNPLLLRVANRSLATIKNVTGYIKIDLTQGQILDNTPIPTFLSKPSDQFMMLAWAKNVDGKISPTIDIHQGETPDLSVFSDEGVGLVLASENGLDYNRAPVRAVLSHLNNYNFEIKITAENMLPISKRYLFDKDVYSIKVLYNKEVPTIRLLFGLFM